MGDLLFTDSTQILSYLGLHTADKGYYSVYQSAFGQKWDFPASFPLASRSFPRRAPVSRESGQFSFSKLFFSTNHCTARGIVSILDPWISTKSALPFLCLCSDLHEIRNLSFFCRARLNRGVVFEFCLFVCLLSWTQLAKSAAISLFMLRFA